MATNDPLNFVIAENFGNTELFQRINKKLREDTWYRPALDYLEASFNIGRVYLVTGCCASFIATVLFLSGIQLISCAVGFLYPGYQTIKCIEKFDENQGKRWLKYWVVISAIYFIERFLFFLPWIPAYWIIKCIFLICCYAPTVNGADVIYSLLICPLFRKNQSVIEGTVSRLMKTAHTICSEANN